MIKHYTIPLLLTIMAIFAHGTDFKVPVTYDTLQNGLKIIIVPDTNVAVVSSRLYYFVGSMNEGPGTSGLSHMYEHMMFKGTKTLGTQNYKKESTIMRAIDSLAQLISKETSRTSSKSDSIVNNYKTEMTRLLEKQRSLIKKDEVWELYQNSGATDLNAWTSDDMTAYIVTLPENKLELFYWIESDRMKSPVLREFYSERDVVMEERHMRYENQPLNKYWERLIALFYVAHPYRLPTIGWKSDIENYTRENMENHIRKYYTPDNALLVLVGNVDPKKALVDIKKYFEKIPRATIPKQEVVTREPEPIGTTRFTVLETAEPRIDILFPTPGYPDDDLYRMDVLESVLSGKTGRLYKKLVDQEGLCTNAGAGNAIRLHNGYFTIWAELKSDTDPDIVEKFIWQELASLTERPPSVNEMMKIKNEIRLSFVSGLKNLETLSDRLAYFERIGSWKDLLSYPDKIATVKSDDLTPVVNKYLDQNRATIGRLLPKKTTTQSTSETPEPVSE